MNQITANIIEEQVIKMQEDYRYMLRYIDYLAKVNEDFQFYKDYVIDDFFDKNTKYLLGFIEKEDK